MLTLLDHLDRDFYTPRVYVSAATDALSAAKAAAREQRWAASEQRRNESTTRPAFKCVTIPRSREVGQPWLSSAFTTLRALFAAAAVVARERPALLLCNGPGTCVPLALAAVLWRTAGVCEGGTRIAYVESVARVRRLSLSARLLRMVGAADLLLVQWPELARPAALPVGSAGAIEYEGRLF